MLSLIKGIFVLVFGLFVLGGLISGLLFVWVVYSAVTIRPAVVPIRYISPPVTFPTDPKTNTKNQQDTAPPIIGPDRINVLLLGVDRRDDEVGWPTRSDTMIILTLNHRTKVAGMLTIPRDLWVEIPSSKGRSRQDKITAAHAYGDLDKYPDGKNPNGGAELARRTVELNFGIPIHYFVELDFHGFEKAIDAIGGVNINVERELVDYAYPTPDYGTIVLRIPAGLQHMNGERALQFVRTRHPDSDFGRMKRQQQFLLTLRDQALRLDLVPKLPELLNLVRNSVVTDMPLGTMIALANVARQVKTESIIIKSIESTMVYDNYPIEGALAPKRKEIAKVIEELFSDSVVPTGAAAREPSTARN